MKYPTIRRDLIRYLDILSDTSYQENIWLSNKICYYNNKLVHDSFDMFIHFWYDDYSLNENIIDSIGDFLKDQKEAAAIQRITNLLDKIFERIGTTRSAREYLNCDEWPNIVLAAKEAKRVFLENEDMSGAI